MSDKTPNKLVVLYQQMAEHTQPECAHTCRIPFSCCSREYCEMNLDFAKEQRGFDLTAQFKAEQALPFMGPSGCVIAAHLRPLCTLHTCQINSLGVKPNDPEWTTRYFRLRSRIEDVEYKLRKRS